MTSQQHQQQLLLPQPDQDVLYSARSMKSKDKVLRFFGEPTILMQTGGGSTSKLESFYGVNSIRAVSAPSLMMDPASSPTNKTSTVDALLDKPVPAGPPKPSSAAAAQGRRKRGESNASDISEELASIAIPGNKRLSSGSHGSSRRWSLPSPTVAEGFQNALAQALADAEDQPQPGLIRRPSRHTAAKNAGGGANQNGKVNPILPSLQPNPSLRKLVSILGDDARIDVPIKEIAAQGLTALLDSKLPLCYFLVYLLKEYSSEILFFILDVQAFEQTLFPSTMSQNMAAQVIFNTYLAPSSLLEVNASHRARRQVIDGVQQGLRCCFASAQEETVELLDRSFELFKKSSVWTAMEADVGNSMVIAPAKVEQFKTVIHNVLSTHYLSNEQVTLSTRRNVALREKVPALLLSRIGLSL
ncbi:hypothetical protein HDU67_006529 [Dinochytrium kinnereticum]|nr:hypothetical protein HDU67_006529 [Dinochytrium kinnereticum]